MFGLTSPQRARPLTVSTALILLATTAISARAHDAGPLADAHAPAGVMLDHMHKAGDFMIGYRYSWSRTDQGMLDGMSSVDLSDPSNPVLHKACQNPDVAGHEHCSMVPSKMTMQMHMLDIMYAPTDWLTLMVMPQWMTMEMTMSPLGAHEMDGMDMDHGGHMGVHSHDTDGIGDTIFGALIKLSEGPDYHLHTGLMFSAPTGSTSETGSGGKLTHYMMQLGSGTWDFLPSFTYTGRAERLTWGGQLSGIIRMEDENDQGYRLGNVFQSTAWGSYRLVSWLSVSARLLYTYQGEIEGWGPTGNGQSPADFGRNYGGRFWDAGFGVNTVVPSGPLQGHRFSVEWLEPIYDNVNGYQQERDGTLWLNWSKAF